MWDLEAEQIGIRCSILRGGTSKGIYFRECDVPPPGPERDRLLLRIMGSPDVMQIDGLGGSSLLTSKIAIVGPAKVPGADLDYTFAQVDVARPIVDYSANCGNISSGVAPFAIDAGMLAIEHPVTVVRIRNINTGKILVAHVPVFKGRARVGGDLSIAGVPGTGAEIFMDFRDSIGAKTGKALPTGRRVDRIALEDGRTIEVTICDVANTIVFCQAQDLGLLGTEGPAQIDGDRHLLERMLEVRGKAAELIGFCKSWRNVEQEAPLLPLLYFVAPPMDFATLGGEHVPAARVDLLARQMFFNRCHEAMAGTGSMCLAVASRIEGSIVARQMRDARPAGATLTIGHPSGAMAVTVASRSADNIEGVAFDRLGFGRTARKIMDGTVYVPAAAA